MVSVSISPGRWWRATHRSMCVDAATTSAEAATNLLLPSITSAWWWRIVSCSIAVPRLAASRTVSCSVGLHSFTPWTFGYGQLAGSLRVNPRVCTLERTNLGEVDPSTLDPQPTLVTLDLSYLSLTAALPLAAHLFTAHGEVLALFKPLFEVDDPEARRTGRVDDPKVLVEALRRVLDSGQRVGLVPRGLTKLALRPRHGVLEFFLHFTSDPAHIPLFYDDATLANVVATPGIGRAEEGL